jgi:transposase
VDWATTPPAVRALVRVLFAHLPVLQPQQADLQAQVATLQAQVAALRARLNQHSGNSARPPSSDPPGALPRPQRPPTGRKPGAQPGHPGQHRAVLPPDQVTEIVVHTPDACSRCHAPLAPELPATGGVLRQQVWDLPPVQPHITEHQFPTVTCPHGAALVRATRPPEVPPGAFGPRVAALVALLPGRDRLSDRDTATLLEDLYGLLVSLGSMPALHALVSAALTPVYERVHTTVTQQPVANVDETSWKEAGKRRWWWVAVTAVATLFQVAQQRSAAALAALVGDNFTGIVGADRYCAYNSLPVAQRQLCWGPLKRNWEAFRERDGPVGSWGDDAIQVIDRLFTIWYGFRVGDLDRPGLRAEMAPIQAAVRALVERGRDELPWEKARSFCRDLLLGWPALWTFVDVPGVEPTNHAAERALRPAVLWRKGCFGAQSAAGNTFVAHILTVTTTCRQQQRHVLTFLTDAVRAHWAGLPAPTLLPTT